jgi:stage II sporulation SpoAA-like protein
MAKVRVTKNGNIHHLQFGTLGCTVLGPHQWDDAEWDEFLDSPDPETAKPAVATLTIYVAPLTVNAYQRKKSAARADLTTIKHMAVLTDSAIARGVTTAFGWITQKFVIKCYPLSELRAALRWLSECGAEFDAGEVEEQMTAIMRELAPVVQRQSRG